MDLRRGGAGSSLMLSFDDCIKAKHGRKAPGREDVPHELLATWGPVSDAVVPGFCLPWVAYVGPQPSAPRPQLRLRHAGVKQTHTA